MHGNTRQWKRYPEIPNAIFQHFYPTPTCLLPNFFFKTRPVPTQYWEGKKTTRWALFIGACKHRPSSSTSTKIIVMSPQQEGGSQYYMIIDHPQWKGRSGTPRRQIKTHHKTRYSCVQCKSFSGNLVKLELWSGICSPQWREAPQLLRIYEVVWSCRFEETRF